MRSYAAIESITDRLVKCELEMIEYTSSFADDFSKETIHVEIPIEMVKMAINEFEIGDIIIIFHYNGSVNAVLRKCPDEKNKRIDLLTSLGL